MYIFSRHKLFLYGIIFNMTVPLSLIHILQCGCTLIQAVTRLSVWFSSHAEQMVQNIYGNVVYAA